MQAGVSSPACFVSAGSFLSSLLNSNILFIMMCISKDSAEFIVKVIRTLLEKYPMSDKFMDCDNKSEFYDDSVKVMAMRAEFRALASSLQSIAHFMDLAE